MLKEHKVKIPADLDSILEDLKVCGKNEMSKLLTMRHKYQASVKAQNAPAKKEEPELTAEQQIEKDLEEALERIEREKKRAAKKEREEKKKHDLRQKMSVIATQTGIENDEELYLPQHMWEQLRQKGLDEMSDAEEVSESSAEEEEDVSEHESIDEMEIDDKVVATEMMFQQMEANIKNQREFEGLRDRNLAGKQLKMKQLIES